MGSDLLICVEPYKATTAAESVHIHTCTYHALWSLFLRDPSDEKLRPFDEKWFFKKRKPLSEDHLLVAKKGCVSYQRSCSKKGLLWEVCTQLNFDITNPVYNNHPDFNEQKLV